MIDDEGSSTRRLHHPASPRTATASDAVPVSGPFPCAKCGERALFLLGETRHSIALRCSACGEVTVQRRHDPA
jgi:predicted RNA-binding Zn-ribbon protein involved in translation (DUF1610 family)